MMNNQQTPNFQSMQNSFVIAENVPEIHFECSDGQPMQLVRILNNRSFEVVQETLDFLRDNIDGGISFCSIVGKYRTGKSFLMNKLLDLQKSNGFVVSALTDACTKGIWIWSKPIYIQKDNLSIIFMDTEGLDSVNRDSDIDSRLFALSVMLSSYFIYNSIGAIDESSINSLALITHLIKTITIEENKRLQNEYQLSQYAPKLLWILRDFVLEIKDTRGRNVTPAQYLDSALSDLPTGPGGYTRDVAKSTQVRQSILNFFKYRDCVTLVRPVNDENELRNVQDLPDGRIRPEFMNQLHLIRDKIYKNCTQKVINGVGLNSNMFAVYLKQFVDSFNSGKMPAIQTAWRALLENECKDHYDQAIQFYNTEVRNLMTTNNGSMPTLELFTALNNFRDTVLNYYNRCAYIRERNPEIFERYKKKLKDYVNDSEKQVIETSNNTANSRNADLLNNYVADYIKKTNLEMRNEDDVANEISQFVFGKYVEKNCGGLQTRDFCQNAQNFTFNIVGWYMNYQSQNALKKRNSLSRRVNKESEKLRVEAEQLSLKENKINSMQQEVDYLDRKIADVKKGVDTDTVNKLQKQNDQLTGTERTLNAQKEQLAGELTNLRQQIEMFTKKKKGC